MKKLNREDWIELIQGYLHGRFDYDTSVWIEEQIVSDNYVQDIYSEQLRMYEGFQEFVNNAEGEIKEELNIVNNAIQEYLSERVESEQEVKSKPSISLIKLIKEEIAKATQYTLQQLKEWFAPPELAMAMMGDEKKADKPKFSLKVHSPENNYVVKDSLNLKFEPVDFGLVLEVADYKKGFRASIVFKKKIDSSISEFEIKADEISSWHPGIYQWQLKPESAYMTSRYLPANGFFFVKKEQDPE